MCNIAVASILPSKRLQLLHQGHHNAIAFANWHGNTGSMETIPNWQ